MVIQSSLPVFLLPILREAFVAFNVIGACFGFVFQFSLEPLIQQFELTL
jgi:hypothetical protein